MKKIYAMLIMLACTYGLTLNAQTINNAGFENWENVGSDTEEPNDWNSFKTAGGSSFLLTFAQKQLVRSDVVRPGTTGSYSALIWSTSILSIVANGNVTTGKINMGNSSPTHQDNYNATVTSDAAFNEAFTGMPDSIAFWVRFAPASGLTSDSGRMHAVIHDAYDYRDPSTSDPNGPNHVVADALVHFAKTDGQWVRISTPFVAGPASGPAYMLITFTTNKTAGGGSAGDSLYVDDIEFVYPSGIREAAVEEGFTVSADRTSRQVVAQFAYNSNQRTHIAIYNIAGQLVSERTKNLMKSEEVFTINGMTSGIYFMQVTREDGSRTTKKFAVR